MQRLIAVVPVYRSGREGWATVGGGVSRCVRVSVTVSVSVSPLAFDAMTAGNVPSFEEG
jgi:hypothetical protein